MKIAIVCYPTFGGSGVVATELGLELARRGHEIHFITYRQPVRLALLNPNVHYHEVNVPEYPLFHYQPYELALSSKLVDMVKLHKIDLLHVHYAIPHAYAGYMAKQMLKDQGIIIPMVTTLHGTDITLVGNHPNYKTAVTFSINKSDKVTSVSQSLKDDTLRLFDIRNEIKVIPNFIELENKILDNIPCKRSVMARPEERIITHISNFRKVKNIPDVVKVFYKIQQKIPAKLMMVGDGPEKAKAEKLCDKLGISDKVIFFGNSNEISQILTLTDLFLLPSETESFGLAALEAMACSVPVISSNSGGLPEVNIDGVSGYLSNIGAVNEMAENALKIISDEDNLNLFKKKALEVAKQFSVEKIVPLYENLYLEAIAESKKNIFNQI
ncbi:N-acetyl-alpha-D-glucosaminyl L-malate synthase BshA [Flavobacterium psychrophilum]|jgi:N-acetyl-alpha-D-glucosaminyl L-malate synthase BshA|uniref:N-acetyl-alpha-D-glucosaminyl L-malate synthase BshA n=1 Tax=Flavobacterium psychrophilum TaxID=96345 RepID=A0A238N100_FLAPS|nr:N-acetyl-alpha-D-glucosaminyl L-malate synthase BshA [Flavobacterium psychrophilum]AIN73991.1 N-acetyl-alpha-D-glucosaminyl L-malate synthase [Flavobacterium psychrophilum FPG3]EKT2069513.1 N-acetyl-alpha-D-glucosaminyl L-malate synthase BshA [Flavobacterium psychrophilum]EKT2071776.1 N-acetyl-alpha-D-glucosaminyl L-malate synthase BshA [Flavobacterium psychrophilum]EKT3957331.1 N-acetyl-alpha-D-glucosaminyl L-malate synthase BshA [Flavobacterium psychrophilum]EKT3964068.1 N-acetyl-alpha-D-